MAKKGTDLVLAQDGNNALSAIDFNNAVRETASANSKDTMPALPDPSGIYQSTPSNNEIKSYIDYNILSRANAFVCSGGGNAYVITTNASFHNTPLKFSLQYQRVGFIASFSNTGACVASVDTNGSKPIQQFDGTELSAGMIISGKFTEMIDDGTNWLLLNVVNNTNEVGDYKYSAKTSNHGKWLVCEGALISRTTYAVLFSLIGITFGAGDGVNTFALPDFRGRVAGVIGQGNGLTNRNLGDSIGEENHLLTINEIPEMPVRGKSISYSGADGGNGAFGMHTSDLGTYENTIGNDIRAKVGSAPNLGHNNMQPTIFGGNIFIYSGV